MHRSFFFKGTDTKKVIRSFRNSGSRAPALQSRPSVCRSPVMTPAVFFLCIGFVAALHNHSERISIALSHDATFSQTGGSAQVAASNASSRLFRIPDRGVNVTTAALGKSTATGTFQEKPRVPLRKLGLMSIAGLVAGYWMTVVAREGSSPSKDAPNKMGEDRSLWSATPEALPWMVLSMILSIFNKWIFIPHPGSITASSSQEGGREACEAAQVW